MLILVFKTAYNIEAANKRIDLKIKKESPLLEWTSLFNTDFNTDRD